jgi:TPR repeat protein
MAMSHVHAFHHYKVAAQGGDVCGKAGMAQCLFLGRGVARDATRGCALAREASAAGSATGMLVLGHCLEQGQGVPRDKRAAFRLYMSAAKSGQRRGDAECRPVLRMGYRGRER